MTHHIQGYWARRHDDLRVVARLNEGEPAWDIELLACPLCGREGYFSGGDFFGCLNCDQSFWVLDGGRELWPGWFRVKLQYLDEKTRKERVPF
jgi:hypothetical protein